MNKVTLIVGPRNSGKTTKLLGLTKGLKATIINCAEKSRSEFLLTMVAKDTQVIAFDNVNESGIDMIKNFIVAKKIHKVGGKSKRLIGRPYIVFTINTDLFKRSDWENLAFIDIIYLDEFNNKVSENEPKPDKLSKGEQLGNLLIEAEKLSHEMRQLFLKNKVAELHFAGLPKEDFERWYELKGQHSKLGDAMCKVILGK